MADLKSTAEEKVEETTSQDNSPKSEAQPTEAQTPKTEVDQPKSEGESDGVESSMSEEQRRAFQEQRLEIKRLKEEKQARLKSESAFQVFKPRPAANLAEPVRVEDYTDPVTGEINRPAYNAAMEARQARIEAARADQSFEERIDEYRAREKYPDLFANPVIEKRIAAEWYFEKVQGNNVTVSEIAESYAREFSKAVSKAEKVGAEKALEQVTPKEQAALQASSQTSAPAQRVASEEELDRLRAQSRGVGGSAEEAIAARMKAIPWANK